MIAPQANAQFVAAMEKVLDVYSLPYDAKNPVVCMDETPRQLIRETREPIAAAAGRPERHDYEYERCGVCNVFMASEPLAGRRLSKVTERRTKADWAVFVQDIAASYPDAERITLVMDLPQHAHPGLAVRGVCPRAGQGALGPLRVCLHAQARQLAEHGRNRDQRHGQPMSGPAHRPHRDRAKRSRCLAKSTR